MPTDGIAVLLIKTSGDFGKISVFRATSMARWGANG
jgi:hypothetical protein